MLTYYKWVDMMFTMKIIQNAIKIVESYPEEVFLVSAHRHDFKQHVFKNGETIFVDGGNEYIRRGGSALGNGFFPAKGYAELWVDWSLSDDIPLDVIAQKLLWGTRGKDGKQPLKYVRLASCETDHLQAILKNVPNLSDLYNQVINLIIFERDVTKEEVMDEIKQMRTYLYDSCQNCKSAPAKDPHSCPYNEEMGGLNRQCNCCSDCTRRCAEDV
jgi:hypothetical protein